MGATPEHARNRCPTGVAAWSACARQAAYMRRSAREPFGALSRTAPLWRCQVQIVVHLRRVVDLHGDVVDSDGANQKCGGGHVAQQCSLT